MAPTPPGPSSPDPATPRPDQSPSPSIRTQTPNLHAPARPSQLREAHSLSSSPDKGVSKPGDGIGGVDGNSDNNSNDQSPPSTTTPTAGQTGPQTKDKDTASSSPEVQSQSSPSHSREPRNWLGRPPKLARDVSRESTPLLQRPLEISSEQAHEGPCNHGTFSPNMISRPASIKSQETTDSARDRGFFRSVAAGIAPSNNAKRNTTARLAEEHGLTLNKTMYVFLLTSWSLS
jgi:hypothetical protein